MYKKVELSSLLMQRQPRSLLLEKYVLHRLSGSQENHQRWCQRRERWRAPAGPHGATGRELEVGRPTLPPPGLARG